MMEPPPLPPQVDAKRAPHLPPPPNQGPNDPYENSLSQIPDHRSPHWEPCSCCTTAPEGNTLSSQPEVPPPPAGHPQTDTPEDPGKSSSIHKGADLILDLLNKEKHCLADVFQEKLASEVGNVRNQLRQMSAVHQGEKLLWEEERLSWGRERENWEQERLSWEQERRQWDEMRRQFDCQLNEEHRQLKDLKKSHAQANKVNAEMIEMMRKWKDEKDSFQAEADEWKEKYRQLYAHWEGRESHWKEHHEAIDRAGCIVSDGQLKRKKSAPMGLYLQTDFSA
ncbi:unnamed protein product [Cyclocybe aegerita]|uniref:Uncharacterized protein n=1 Tax=Cyclocybe aegerita TaxID=1973307 RepID=A0A8S0WJD3_CYCAE|nr:unnamed protein product [Cyclocybe aegerita]